MLPIEIINKIIGYVSDLNNDMMITQYDCTTHKEYYKINFNSKLLYRIMANLTMKRLYPCSSILNHIELYTHGSEHYENEHEQQKCSRKVLIRSSI